jgi:CBS domain-containing protein
VCINANELALNAFLRIRDAKVSGIPIVDPDLGGRMIGNISASDIKEIGWSAEFFNKLFMSSKDFARHCDAAREARKQLPRVVWCRPDFSLFQVLLMLRQYKVHRVYVLDDRGAPAQCITMTDILKIFASNSPHR